MVLEAKATLILCDTMGPDSILNIWWQSFLLLPKTHTSKEGGKSITANNEKVGFVRFRTSSLRWCHALSLSQTLAFCCDKMGHKRNQDPGRCNTPFVVCESTLGLLKQAGCHFQEWRAVSLSRNGGNHTRNTPKSTFCSCRLFKLFDRKIWYKIILICTSCSNMFT